MLNNLNKNNVASEFNFTTKGEYYLDRETWNYSSADAAAQAALLPYEDSNSNFVTDSITKL